MLRMNGNDEVVGFKIVVESRVPRHQEAPASASLRRKRLEAQEGTAALARPTPFSLSRLNSHNARRSHSSEALALRAYVKAPAARGVHTRPQSDRIQHTCTQAYVHNVSTTLIWLQPANQPIRLIKRQHAQTSRTLSLPYRGL